MLITLTDDEGVARTIDADALRIIESGNVIDVRWTKGAAAGSAVLNASKGASLALVRNT